MNILLVEDDEDVRETIASMLRRANHEVTVATDGREGWEEFREHTFHVVLSDWTMPRLDGIGLCRLLRSLARDTYTYVVMLTAMRGAEKIVEALDAGADDFLTKPLNAPVLAARLRVAERILNLRAHASRLEGLLSMCQYCKQIRSDDGTWVPVERYFQDRSELKFSHGLCPACVKKYYPRVARAQDDSSTVA